MSVARLPYRTVQLFGAGLVGEASEATARAMLAALGTMPLRYDALTLEELPSDSPVAALVTGGAAEDRFVKVERARTTHHVVELPASWDEYLSRFTAKTRGNFKRRTRKLADTIGPVTVRTYAESRDMRPLVETIEPIAVRTYHYRLLGQDLTRTNARLLENLELWAAHGWVRAYVLFAGERPCAYAIGFLAGKRYAYELVGYDPELAALSPGNELLTRILEELTTTRAAEVLDFGAGDAEYKRIYATKSWEEVSLLLTRRTAWARGAARVAHGFAQASRLGGRALDRVGLRGKVRAWVRQTA